MIDRIYRHWYTDREQCLEAHRAASEADRIAELTAALSQARTPAAVVEAALQEPLHALGGDAGVMLTVSPDGHTLEVARAVGYRGGEHEARTGVAFAGKTPICDAIDRGAPIMLEGRQAYAAEYERFAATPAAAGFQALAAIPLLVGSRVVAVLQIEFREPRAFTADDRRYLAMLGPRAAQALDRTWQYETALRARADAEALRSRADEELSERQSIEEALRASEARYRAFAARTSRLHGLAAALSEAVTLDAVAHAIVTHARIVAGATNGDVTLLLPESNEFQTLYSDAPNQDADAPYRFSADPGLCATRAVETRTPIFISSFEEWQERYSRSASIAAGGGYVSAATLPLLVESRAIGVLTLYFTAPVNFDDEYQALLISVAQHCAQALDRARLYETAQRARAEAETANRLKDDFVSIISHELRTPLNAMLGWTSMMRKGSLDPAMSDRALQSIHDNATRQAHLVEELLDFSRMKSGRLSLDVELLDLRTLLRGVVESMIPSASAKGIEMDLTPVPPLRVHGDAHRLEQVFFNVLGNAVKFTDTGGRIAISAGAADENAVVRISDTGAGIEPAFLPFVFDRFRQADNAMSRRHGGIGLGLAIAKELVDAHGGHIRAESAGPGQGATFTVVLPIDPTPAPGPAGGGDVRSSNAPASGIH